MGWIYLSFKNMVEDDGYVEGHDDGYDEGFEDGQKYASKVEKEMNFED